MTTITINVDNTTYTSFETAFKVIVDDIEIGRVWCEGPEDWNAYCDKTDESYDLIDSFEDAIEIVRQNSEI